MSNVVIKAEHLSKMYRLGVINNGTLWKDLQTWTALKFGKEDPHSRIGEDKYAGSEDHFWALKDLDFEIHQGDRVGIIGKNGAGKSTLLKILSRVTAPSEGSIKIKGKIASLLEVGTGFNGELTGRENIYLNGAILGMKKRQIDRKLDEIIAFSEIEHHIDTPVKRYSSGMYVRLAFAVAAHLDSDILIADEVLAVGDAAFQKKALGKMESLSTGEGRTVLFVSHNIAAVKALCNKGLLLEEGRIIETGILSKIISKYDERTSIQFSLSEKKHDNSLRRGAGCVKFLKTNLSKLQYTTHEKIELFFSVKVNSPIIGLYFFLLIKSETNETITIVTHVLEKDALQNNYEKSFHLIIPEKTLRPGRYPIYLWLGDEWALNQGTPTNYEVLDEFLPPINIVESDFEKNSILHDRLISGTVSFNTTLLKL